MIADILVITKVPGASLDSSNVIHFSGGERERNRSCPVAELLRTH